MAATNTDTGMQVAFVNSMKSTSAELRKPKIFPVEDFGDFVRGIYKDRDHTHEAYQVYDGYYAADPTRPMKTIAFFDYEQEAPMQDDVAAIDFAEDAEKAVEADVRSMFIGRGSVEPDIIIATRHRWLTGEKEGKYKASVRAYVVNYFVSDHRALKHLVADRKVMGVAYDSCVYNPKRTLAMVGFVKDGSRLVLKDAGDLGRVERTLITNVAGDAVELPLPKVEDVAVPKKHAFKGVEEEQADAERVLEMIPMLGDSRASGKRDPWLKVGFVLARYSCVYGEEDMRFFKAWDDFSLRCPAQYDYRVVLDSWRGFSTSSHGTVSIGSVIEWLKEDNPDAHKELNAKWKALRKSTKGKKGCGSDVAEGGRSDPVYVQWKEDIEREWLFIQQPPTYIRLYTDGTPPYMCNAHKFEQSFEHSPKVDVGPAMVSCHKLWMTDPAKRCFECMVFRPPPLDVKPREFNMWTGFAVERIPPNAQGTAEPMLEHMRMLLRDAFDYCIKWIARLFQVPAKLARTYLAWCGSQGAGKNIVLDFLEMLMGDSLYFHTTSPESVLFGRFNAALMGKLLVNIDEVDKATMVAGREKLKDMVTNKKISVEKKGIDPFSVENFAAFILTSNAHDSMPVQSNDRRGAIVAVSDDRANDKPYFDALVAYMEKPENQRAFYDYLMAVDISGVDWIADRPNGELYMHMQLEHADDFTKFWLHMYGKFEEGVWAGSEEMVFEGAADFMRQYTKFEEDVLRRERPSVTNTKVWGSLLKTKKVIRKHDEDATAKMEFVLWKCMTGNMKKYVVDKVMLGKWLVKAGVVSVTDVECVFLEE